MSIYLDPAAQELAMLKLAARDRLHQATSEAVRELVIDHGHDPLEARKIAGETAYNAYHATDLPTVDEATRRVRAWQT